MKQNNPLYNDSAAIADFNGICADLRAGKLILATKDIRRLLKCMVYYDELREIIEGCKTGFDYPKAYSRAIVGLGAHAVFKLPQSPKLRVALVVCLLAEFDMQKRDLIKFVLDYFPSENSNRAYERFAENLIYPFQEAFNLIYGGGGIPETVQYEDECGSLSVGLAAQAHRLLSDITKALTGASMDAAARDECLTVTEGFTLALDTRDPFLIKVIWIGLKRTLAGIRPVAGKLRDLEEILRVYKAI
ncbi:MAG: hypothetical protein LBC13_01270 [Clostridiales bacterium]|jgi:hypothetical protein|nr:hypothetical protein [Clostridiales bacterium]